MITQAADPEANIIFGAGIDDSMEDEVRVTVIATGFQKTQFPPRDSGKSVREQTHERLYGTSYQRTPAPEYDYSAPTEPQQPEAAAEPAAPSMPVGMGYMAARPVMGVPSAAMPYQGGYQPQTAFPQQTGFQQGGFGTQPQQPVQPQYGQGQYFQGQQPQTGTYQPQFGGTQPTMPVEQEPRQPVNQAMVTDKNGVPAFVRHRGKK